MQNLTLVPSVFFDEISKLAPPHALTKCVRTTPLSQVVQLMTEKNIGCVIVTEYERPVGIFTERDLMLKVVRQKVNLEKEVIETFMTPNPVCIGANTEIIRAMDKMTKGKFRHLILTDDEGLVSGVISVRDLLNYLVSTITDAMGPHKAAMGL